MVSKTRDLSSPSVDPSWESEAKSILEPLAGKKVEWRQVSVEEKISILKDIGLLFLVNSNNIFLAYRFHEQVPELPNGG
jgi:hypothetical protein